MPLSDDDLLAFDTARQDSWMVDTTGSVAAGRRII
jgi:hypothetical protein